MVHYFRCARHRVRAAGALGGAMVAPHHGRAEHRDRSATPVLLRLSWRSMGSDTSEVDEHHESDDDPGQDCRFQVVQRQPTSFCCTGMEPESKWVTDR